MSGFGGRRLPFQRWHPHAVEVHQPEPGSLIHKHVAVLQVAVGELGILQSIRSWLTT